MKKIYYPDRTAVSGFAVPVLVFAVILFFTGFSEPPVFGLEQFSLGAGAETNVITLGDNTMALGGIVSAETRFGPTFALGVNLGAGYGWNNFINIESRIFSRWYFAKPKNCEFFFQADAGVLATFFTFEEVESRGSPSAGLTIGSRINLPNKWYLEPYVRGGYPFLGGAGILVGYSPLPKSGGPGFKDAPAKPELKNGEDMFVFRQLNSVPEIAALSIETCIYFGSNSARFTGLDKKTVENNYRLMREIVRFLNANGEYSLIIEGHANPVTRDKNEETVSLNPLSIERAEIIANILIQNGVDRRRLIIAGSGGNKTLVPWLDYENWNLNRRVEFALIRQHGGKL